VSSQSDVSAAIVTALGSLVGGRVHARQFPQQISGAAPTYPAIRFNIIDSIPSIDITGGGPTDLADDIRVQIDVVSDATKPETSHLALVAAVRAALDALGREWVFDAQRGLPDDFDKRTHANTLDWVIYHSG